MRTEEEIRERIETERNGQYYTIVAILRWVLEDSEPKPIEKVSCGSNISAVEIAIRTNEIIDRLNEITKSKE